MGLVSKRLSKADVRRVVERKERSWLARTRFRKYLPYFRAKKHLAEAVRFVDNLYGLNKSEEPSMILSTRISAASNTANEDYGLELDKRFPNLRKILNSETVFSPISRLRFFFESIKHKALDFLRELQYVLFSMPTYITSIKTINFPHVFFNLSGAYERKRLTVHEYVHHRVRNPSTPLDFFTFNFGPHYMTATCCDEGLSVFAELYKSYPYKGLDPGELPISGYLLWKKRSLLNRFYVHLRYGVLTSVELILHPITTSKQILSKFLRNNMTHDGFVSGIETSSFLMNSINPYIDGFDFINGLHDLGLTPPEIFRIVTQELPTLKEIFYPEEYLLRMKVEGKL